MTLQFLGPDPLEQQIAEALRRLADGQRPALIETAQVDVKEEPGRRRGRSVVPGLETNEDAAAYLAGEMACMANTSGGGAVIVGIADDGERIGTNLDAYCPRPLDLVPGVIAAVAGVPASRGPAYRLSDESRHRIGHRCRRLHSSEGQDELLIDWARSRGRASSTEAADLIAVTVVTAGRRLAALAADGLLVPSRPNGTGRGFHYLPAPD